MEGRVVLCTHPDKAAAQAMSRKLIAERLTACANIVGPLTSLYWWQGAVQEDNEYLVIMKTTVKQLEALQNRIHELHPYQVPEFIALEPDSISPKYAAWLEGYLAP